MVIPSPVIAAGVSALGSLLGGRKAAKEQARAIAAQNAYNDPSAIRARAEKAGFNPTLFVGPGVGLQTALAAPVMGQAIQNAALAVADGFTEYGKEKAYSTQLEQQNAELRKLVQTQTLRPEVPGIYGTAQAVSVPAVPQAVDTSALSVGAGAGFDIASSDTSTGVPVVPEATVQATPLMQTYEWDGETLTAPSFIDPDELLAGAAAMAAIAYKKATKARISDHVAMKGRMYWEAAKNAAMVDTVRKQGRTEPLGSGASYMPSKTPWWLTR